MLWMFLLGLFALTVAVIAYPLFFQNVREYFPQKQRTTQDFNEQDALLSALTELEEDYQLGKVSTEDYNRLKLYFQKRYLSIKKPITAPSDRPASPENPQG